MSGGAPGVSRAVCVLKNITPIKGCTNGASLTPRGSLVWGGGGVRKKGGERVGVCECVGVSVEARVANAWMCVNACGCECVWV